MCSNPTTLPDGTVVACRRCSICIDNVSKDWTGRCLAESRTSAATLSVTLTYGRDKDGVDRHERATVLTYSDVQIWLKRLRNNGFPARYLIAGEYGKEKGRAHWHGIMFFEKEAPPVKMYQRYWDDMWTHGHQVWKHPTPAHVKYCCKYIRKDIKDETAQSKFQFSKVPAIGTHYFINRAAKMVEQGLVPHDRFYTFPEAKQKKSRKPIQFYLRGAAYDNFMNAFCYAWQMKHGILSDWPVSELLAEWIEKNWHEELRGVYSPDPKKQPVLTKYDFAEAARREAFKREHNRFYFGKNMMGFYETEWKPDDE